MSAYLAETDVLKPKDPTIKNSDDWEEFELTNVEIRNFKTGQLMSLLHAHPFAPVTVTGKLAPVERQQEKYLVLRNALSKLPAIEIPGTAQHSWGQYESGEFAFWVEGQAGWFHITPSRSYRETYDEMVEAIKLFFFIADIYRKARRKGPSSSLVFQECAEDDRFPCESHEDAVKLFYKHRIFLILAMLDGKEGVNWDPTAIFEYLKSTYPDEVESLIEKLNGEEFTKIKRKGLAASASAKQHENKHIVGPKKDENWWKSKVIWSLIQRCLAQNVLDEEHMTISNFAHILLKRYDINDEDQAANVIHFQAQNLRFMIEKKHESSRNRLDVQWLKLPIYRELGYVQLPAATIRQIADVELRPRKAPLDYSDVDSEGPGSSIDGRSTRTRRLRAGKSSALRPKPSKSSKKANIFRRGKFYQKELFPRNVTRQMDVDRDESEEVETIDIDEIIPDQGTAKRRIEDDLIDIRPRKRGSSAAPNNNLLTPSTMAAYSPSASTSSDIDSNAEDNLTARTGSLPLRWKPQRKNANGPTSEVDYLPSITVRALPSAAANAPGDVYTCPYDGCLHKVYNASAQGSQALIKNHIRKHEATQQEQLNLVRDVEQRSNLPVNNLINRIRQMAELQQNVFQSPFASGDSSAAAFMREVQRKH